MTRTPGPRTLHRNVPAIATLLGAARLGPDAPLPADRRGLLLALLATDGGWVDRERLATLFWPESDEGAAKAALRQLLVRVKRLDLDPPLEATATAVRWPVATDLARFRRALADGDPEAAVAAYGGPFLDGLAVADVGGVDAWVEAERSALHDAFHGASVRVADAHVATGRYADAATLLERLEALDPLAEDVVAARVRALYLAGRRDAALHAYERFAARLGAELALEPLATTRALVEAVRVGAPVDVPRVARAPEPPRRMAPSRLVARDAERAVLLGSDAPLVLVAGEPGIGKTALLHEAFPDAVRAGGVEGLEALPYHPWAALVRERTELAAGLGAYREDLARLVPEVAPDLVPAPLDPGAARGRLTEALARFVAAAGVPLVLDDLQWADAATLEVLGYVARRGVPVRGAYRRDEASPVLRAALAAWRSAGMLTEVPLGPLPAEGVRSLIADLMGHAEGPPVFAGALHRRSGGNPLFLLETLRALFEAGVLRADERGWHTDLDDVTRDYAELPVPAKVGEVIARRLAHLGEATVRVLEALAVAQADLDAGRLARVTGLSVAAVADALDAAAAAGFLTPTPGARGDDARPAPFRHDLLREALDARLPSARRRLLHARLAEALEGGDPGRRAEHWWAAGDAARARTGWLEQATSLRARGLHAEARTVLAAGRSRLHGVDAAWLHVEEAHVAQEAGDPEGATALLETLDLEGAPAELQLRGALARVAVCIQAGLVQEAQAVLDAAAPWGELVEDENLVLEHTLQRAFVAMEGRRPDEAIALLEPAMPLVRAGRPDPRRARFVTSLAALYDDVGRAEEALPLHHEALTLAKALGARYVHVDACINLLFCTADLGRPLEAAALAEEALGLGEYDNVPVLRANLAAAYFEAGCVADAARHYRLLTEHDGPPYLLAIALARSAECAALEQDDERVAPLLDRALDAVASTELAVAQGSVAIAVLHLGDHARVARLRTVVPDLDLERFPRHQRDRLAAALAARGPA